MGDAMQTAAELGFRLDAPANVSDDQIAAKTRPSYCQLLIISLLLLPLTLSGQSPQINTGGIVNIASLASTAIAPGSIISIFGANFAAGTWSAPSFPLPSSVNGTQVTINGLPAPMFMVSPNQINAQ